MKLYKFQITFYKFQLRYTKKLNNNYFARIINVINSVILIS